MDSSNHKSFDIYCDEISSYDLLSKEEEKLLSDDIKKGGKRKSLAKQKLINHNLRLVVKIAGHYQGMGLDLEDLVSEGNLGIIEAAKRFDFDKGAKFSSYSSFWIKQYIRKALSNKSRTIRVPSSAIERFNEVLKYKRAYEEKNGVEPSLPQIAKRFNTSKARVEAIFDAVLGTISLDSPMNGESHQGRSKKIYEVIPDEPSISPDNMALAMESARLVERALIKSDLTDREKFIVESRFGLKGKDRQTLEGIGLQLKITRERVRQIEEVALWKIKNFFKELK
tara:strand:- start:5938 stop:6783 length:846 start_codon:yes stop_codon:yes gene_type:complete